MPIHYFSEDLSFRLQNKTAIRKWLNAAIKQEGSSCGSINFIFCSDEYLLEKNLHFLNHNTLTDIITFDYSTVLPGKKVVSGDIFISIARVTENAAKFNVSFEKELSRVVIHGVLHLLVYTDKSKAQKHLMRSREDFYLPLLSETSWK